MYQRVAVIACVGLTLLLGACSSSGKSGSATTQPTLIVPVPTTTPASTLPAAQLEAALAKLFAKNGAAARLLEFERVSAPIATGRKPTPAQCRAVIQDLGKVGSSDEMIRLTGLIPDPTLSKAFHDEVAAKHLLLAACDNGTLPDNAAPLIKKYTDDLRARLAKLGYTI